MQIWIETSLIIFGTIYLLANSLFFVASLVGGCGLKEALINSIRVSTWGLINLEEDD